MKTIWVLGAGASISHTKGLFPSINQFFLKAKEACITTDSQRKVKEEYLHLSEYIESVIGKNILNKRDLVDIEEVLTLVEIDRRRNDAADTRELYESILSVITKVIHTLQEQCKGKEGDFDRFIKTLESNDTVITFNWDTLLDDKMKRRQLLSELYKDQKDSIYYETENQYKNFLLNLSPYREITIAHMTIAPPSKEYVDSKGYLIKLHGSVDWWYCNNKTCRAWGKPFPLLLDQIDQKTYHCSECFGELEQLIVPPILFKEYAQYPFLGILWNVAVREIYLATKIVLWGYSLPPTDFYSNWLLRQANLSKLQEVTIINTAIVKGIKEKAWNYSVLRHLLKPFKHKITTKHLSLYETFSDYLKQENVQNKYNLNELKYL